MLLKWLDASEATAAGTALADDFYLQSASGLAGTRRKESGARPQGQELQKFLQKFLQRVDQAARPLKLNVFKRAKLANSFKWRLLEKGVERELVDDLTQALVMRLMGADGGGPAAARGSGTSSRRIARDVQALHVTANELLGRRAFSEARESYQQLVNLDPRDAAARNGLGIALARLSSYDEAEKEFRCAIGIKAGFAEAHFNLAGVLQLRGRYSESEQPLRRALKLRPSYLDARVSLGMSMVLLNRLREARDCYEKALRMAPSNTQALVGLGQIDSLEGRFAEAERAFRRALEIDPNSSFACAALVSLRKMTPADSDWVERAERIAAGGLTQIDEATLRFAMGKYYDDIGDFASAFRNYKRANELHRLRATPYDERAHTLFVDDLIRVYTPEALSVTRAGACDSTRPVFVVGMPRSGTSLVEQILASHPAVHGAGELEFWITNVDKHEQAIRAGMIDEPLRRKLAAEYLRVLQQHSPSATRVVDKAPVNGQYLGLIYSVFPNARIIQMRRDPIDTCLSCYFQQFSPLQNFTTDLADLASYHRQHARLEAHWRRVLPSQTLLQVPYAELVAEPEQWTRRLLEFVGLPWDERCLQFHRTERAVTSASVWQVRQKIYRTSVQRWRNYEKYIGPLLALKELDS
jgi:tetratricopeptide (TPR) repeat protein